MHIYISIEMNYNRDIERTERSDWMLYVNGIPTDMTMVEALRLINANADNKKGVRKATKNKLNRK